MVGDHLDHLRDLDGRHRHVHRQCRHPTRARRLRRLGRRDHLGLDRLHHRQRHRHALGRLAWTSLRAQESLPVVHASVPCRLVLLRHRAVARNPGLLSHLARSWGRGAAAHRAGHLARDVSARGAGDGHVPLRPGGDDRPRHRADAGRLARGPSVLALDLLRQPSRRRARSHHGPALRARSRVPGGRQRAGTSREGRLSRAGPAGRRSRLVSASARARRPARLVLEPRDRYLGSCRRDRPDRIRDPRAHRGASPRPR